MKTRKVEEALDTPIERARFALNVALACAAAATPLAVQAQVGPFNVPGSGTSASPLPPELRDRPARRRTPPPPPPPPATANAAAQPDRLQSCLSDARESPQQAADEAEEWATTAQGAERAAAQECLGAALGGLDRWDDARAAFLAGREAAPATNRALRARLGAMAGGAAFAEGDNAGALAAFDPARADAQAAQDKALIGAIAVDRAIALVALKRNDEAAASLAEARVATPDNASAWLLSATLSRRQGKLGEAQTQIERAADLRPIDPEIGLEAGLIAVLSGRDEAARKSWQSVIAAAPQSEAAKTAQGYLDQLSPPAAGPATR